MSHILRLNEELKRKKLEDTQLREHFHQLNNELKATEQKIIATTGSINTLNSLIQSEDELLKAEEKTELELSKSSKKK